MGWARGQGECARGAGLSSGCEGGDGVKVQKGGQRTNGRTGLLLAGILGSGCFCDDVYEPFRFLGKYACCVSFVFWGVGGDLCDTTAASDWELTRAIGEMRCRRPMTS